MTTNAINVFDFTSKAETNDKISIINSLNQHCKHWVFQLEQGEGGYIHFQGRCSLKIRSRKANILGFKDTKYTPTNNETVKNNNFDYVMKEETRIDGPWSDKDTVTYIPLQYRNKLNTLKPFQKSIIEISKNFDDRKINLIYCPDGNKGKSTIAHLMRLHYGALVLPPLNDADRLIYTCCNMAMAKNIRKSIPIFIDLPRAMNKERLFGLFSAIEVIKQGYLCDTRNHNKEWDMDCPIVWVFTNTEPDFNYVSHDRWRIYTINDADDLVEFKALRCNNINSTSSAHSAQIDFLSIDNDDL